MSRRSQWLGSLLRLAAYSLILALAALDLDGSLARAAESGTPEVIYRWDLPGAASPAKVVAADGRVFTLMRAGSKSNLFVTNGLERPDDAGGLDGFEGAFVPGFPKDLSLLRTVTVDPVTDLPNVEEHLYVATVANGAEVVVLSAPPGGPVTLERTIDLPGTANALSIAVDGDLIYVGRSRSARSPNFVVLDPDGTIEGSINLPQAIETIDVVSPRQVRASSRRLTFDLDLSDPSTPLLVATTLRGHVPEPPLTVPRTVDFANDGPLSYLVARQRGQELQQVNLRKPLNFPDVNGDGVRTLACVGDSNTAEAPTLTRWCEKLAQLVDDENFVTLNFAVAGATAIPADNSAYQQLALALDPSAKVDAVVLAFGTNDTNLVNFSTDPSLFDSQIQNIADNLENEVEMIQAHGLPAYVATAPPRFKALFGPDGYNDRIIALNDQIRLRFAPSSVVEFYDYFYADRTEILDGVHLNQRGQDKRAWRAFEALTR